MLLLYHSHKHISYPIRTIARSAIIEGNGVAYGLSYQDNGNGSSKVKLLISPLYQSKTYECGTNISVANEFKDQLSLTLIEDSAEIDKVGVIALLAIVRIG